VLVAAPFEVTTEIPNRTTDLPIKTSHVHMREKWKALSARLSAKMLWMQYIDSLVLVELVIVPRRTLQLSYVNRI
jgi:hypothetical protein